MTAKENLLINRNFKINQRGQTSYVGAGYTVDGWKGVGSPTTLVTDNGIKLSAATMYHGIIQLIENYQQLRGKDVVVSIEVLAHSGGECYVEISDGVEPSFLFFSQPGIYSKAFKVSNNATKLEVGIRSRSTTEINTIVHRIKLEEGMHFTGFTTPDPTLELIRCQRYLQVYKTYLPSVIVTPTRHNKPEVYIFTPTTMRINPAVIIESEMQIRGAGVGEVLTQGMLTGTNCLPNAVRLVFDNYTGTALTINNVYSVGGLSGRVILSAEL